MVFLNGFSQTPEAANRGTHTTAQPGREKDFTMLTSATSASTATSSFTGWIPRVNNFTGWIPQR